MKAPLNRKVFVVGYAAATPLGATFAKTWQRAVKGEAGFRKVTRCKVESACDIVGEIPDWFPLELDLPTRRKFTNGTHLCDTTMAVCRCACRRGVGHGRCHSTQNCLPCRPPSTVPMPIASPYMIWAPGRQVSLSAESVRQSVLGESRNALGFTGPIFSPQGACASGNHAIGIGARMIRDGDCDFVLAGGRRSDSPRLIHGLPT